jgi:hypothetical protein
MILDVAPLDLSRDEKPKFKVPKFEVRGVIERIHLDGEAVFMCQKLLERDFRGLSNDSTQAFWLALKPSDRMPLSSIAKALGWSEGLFLAQCLRDAVKLGSLAGAPDQVPKVTALYWGHRLFERLARRKLVHDIEESLEKIRLKRARQKLGDEPPLRYDWDIEIDPV